ncbi:MAG: hypothetical protein RLZZ237_2653 [Pseudomonadota bacterium]|jgi:hypothetical protein
MKRLRNTIQLASPQKQTLGSDPAGSDPGTFAVGVKVANTYSRLREQKSVFLLLFFLLFLLASASASAQEQRLGRLFSSPEQRAQLDAQRYGAPPADKAAPAPPPEPPPPVELNGVVQRSSGHSTIWLNQTPHNDTKGTLRLTNGQRLRLKPGQRYDPASNSIKEVTEAQP